MDLLPSEFVTYATQANVSLNRIQEIIGRDLMQLKLADGEDVSWRETPSKDEISIENLELLENPSQIFTFKKIARRAVFQEYKLFCNSKCDKLSLVGTTSFNSVIYNAFSSQESFIKEITEVFKLYPSIDQELKKIPNLSYDEFFVLLAILELFIEKYPNPNTDWTPNELLVFTKESLLKIIIDSDEKIEDQTWWQHWKEIAKSTIPDSEAIETAMFLLANKELIGLLDEVEGEDVFFIGQSLLWLIRSFAWWDRGFILENDTNKTQLYVFQASSLFALIVEDKTQYSLFNLAGKDLPKLVSNFINFSADTTDSLEERKIETTTIKLNFCPNCGSPVIAGASFCANCGTNLI